MMPNRSNNDKEQRKAERRAQRNLRHAHAKGLLQGILSMLRPGDIALDCGANIGNVAIPLAATGAHVYAYEPDPFAYDQICRRVTSMENVVIKNAAVGVENGTIQLMRPANFDDNPRGGSVKSTVIKGGRNINENADSLIKVKLIDLTEVIRSLVDQHGRIAFLKMDIEGAELEILEKMLEKNLFQHIGLTVAETHERKFKHLAQRFKNLRRSISEKYPITQVNLDWI